MVGSCFTFALGISIFDKDDDCGDDGGEVERWRSDNGDGSGGGGGGGGGGCGGDITEELLTSRTHTK